MLAAVMHLDRRACDRARRSRDARFDGRFFIAVKTTRIYCRPICPARTPKDENVVYFPSAAAAEAAGYRPCLRCRPEAAPGTPAWQGTSAVVSRGLKLIGDGALDNGSVETLAARLGVTGRHLRRLFLQHLGASPLDVAVTRRLHFAKKLIDETALPMGHVAAAAGFGSVRRFNGQIQRIYARTPTQLRTLAGRLVFADPKRYQFRLAYRPPYDWDATVAFLRARATPGVEIVEDSSYRRTIAIEGKTGTIAISRDRLRHGLVLDVRFPDPGRLLSIVERVRRMFDLLADPLIIAEHLGADPLLRTRLAAHPGIRVPGAWDGFELAVRAVIGQQISVAAATTMAGRLAEMFGTKVASVDVASLGRLFPTPSQLATAPVERVGLIAARAETIRRLARETMDGRLLFDRGDVLAALRSIAGIGEWTAGYVAMRALGEPDAFLAGDLVLCRAAGGLTRRELAQLAEAWRPWRAYAVMLLWQGESDESVRKLKGVRR